MFESIWDSPPKRKGKKEQNLFGGLNEAMYGKSNRGGKKPQALFSGGLNSGLGNAENKERDSRRSFSQTQRKEILYQQNNKCARCHKTLDPRDIEYDHKKPWAAGGRTVTVNGRALCGSCHKIVTHEHRLKSVDKKRDEKDGGIFGPPIFKF